MLFVKFSVSNICWAISLVVYFTIGAMEIPQGCYSEPSKHKALSEIAKVVVPSGLILNKELVKFLENVDEVTLEVCITGKCEDEDKEETFFFKSSLGSPFSPSLASFQSVQEASSMPGSAPVPYKSFPYRIGAFLPENDLKVEVFFKDKTCGHCTISAEQVKSLGRLGRLLINRAQLQLAKRSLTGVCEEPFATVSLWPEWGERTLLNVVQFEKQETQDKKKEGAVVSAVVPSEQNVEVCFQNSDELPLRIYIARKDDGTVLKKIVLGPPMINAVSALPYREKVSLLATDWLVHVVQGHKKLDFGFADIPATVAKDAVEFIVNSYALWLIGKRSGQEEIPTPFPRAFYLFQEKRI